MIDGDEVSARMDELDELDRPGLRVAWRQAFGNAPPHFLSMLFMRKALIWDMQCKIYGGVPAHLKRASNQRRMARRLARWRHPPCGQAPSSSANGMAAAIMWM